jgi:hypothetical protein
MIGCCISKRFKDNKLNISLIDNRWHLDGSITYPGAAAEGLLMNVRMVNATFEDRNRSDIDSDEIMNRFITRIPDYLGHGIRAFTLCLQGGYPNYEGALNSAYLADGTLREDYLARIERVIRACDVQGIAVILCCYYGRQDQILTDEKALRNGVVQAVRWIQWRGFTNVLFEVANEFGHESYTHTMLKDPSGIAELIYLAKETAPELLVSSSRQGHRGLAPEVCRASDYVLVHFNQIPLERMPDLIAEAHQYGRPVMCNEDRKTGEEGARAAQICVANRCSWGLMAREVNQYDPPFRFEGYTDDPAVYDALKLLTTAR